MELSHEKDTLFFLNLQGESQDYYQKRIWEVFKGQMIKKESDRMWHAFSIINILYSLLLSCLEERHSKG